MFNLPECIEYTGEYGTEIGVFIPFIYFLQKNNYLKTCGTKIRSYTGMRPYYFFLEDSQFEMKNETRIWVDHNKRFFLTEELSNDDMLFYNGTNVNYYMPPDYAQHFKGYIQSTRPLLVMQNKYNSEWDGPPLNYFTLDDLRYIFTELQDLYEIIYFRTNNFRIPGYAYDHNEFDIEQFYDKEMITNEFPKITVIEQLIQRNNLVIDFNTLKCFLLAEAKATISTIGGFNFFNAYFPSKHLIYRSNYYNAPIYVQNMYVKQFYQNQHNMLCPGRSSDILFASNTEELKNYVHILRTMVSKNDC